MKENVEKLGSKPPAVELVARPGSTRTAMTLEREVSGRPAASALCSALLCLPRGLTKVSLTVPVCVPLLAAPEEFSHQLFALLGVAILPRDCASGRSRSVRQSRGDIGSGSLFQLGRGVLLFGYFRHSPLQL